MPLSAWSPMSAVPPSPANPRIVTSLRPSASAAARSPEIDAPVASIGLSMRATPRAVVGYGVAITVQQHAGIEAIVRGPSAFSRRRMESAAPQPGHAAWPGYISSWAGIVSLAMDHYLRFRFEIGPYGVGRRTFKETEEHATDRLRGDVAAPDPREERGDRRAVGAFVERGAELFGRRPGLPESVGAIDHADPPDRVGQGAAFPDGERPEEPQLGEADLLPLRA